MQSGRERSETHLVEVRSQEVDFSLLLEKTRPELLFQLLLAKDEFDIAVGVVDFALRWVNLRVLYQLFFQSAANTDGIFSPPRKIPGRRGR